MPDARGDRQGGAVRGRAEGQAGFHGRLYVPSHNISCFLLCSCSLRCGAELVREAAMCL
jgi:hypothetical protein